VPYDMGVEHRSLGTNDVVHDAKELIGDLGLEMGLYLEPAGALTDALVVTDLKREMAAMSAADDLSAPLLEDLLAHNGGLWSGGTR